MDLRTTGPQYCGTPSAGQGMSGTTAAQAGWRKVRKFLVAEDGPTAVEYAFMLSLILVFCITAIGLIGTQTQGSYTKTSNSINSAMNAAK